MESVRESFERSSIAGRPEPRPDGVTPSPRPNAYHRQVADGRVLDNDGCLREEDVETEVPDLERGVEP